MSEIKGIIVQYDKPTKDGVIYKKGCFDSVNKIVDIKHADKTIGKGKLVDKENGIYVEGYVTESEIKDGIRIIKDIELTGIGISSFGFNEREASEYE